VLVGEVVSWPKQQMHFGMYTVCVCVCVCVCVFVYYVCAVAGKLYDKQQVCLDVWKRDLLELLAQGKSQCFVTLVSVFLHMLQLLRHAHAHAHAHAHTHARS
jgi:hypothetical protein